MINLGISIAICIPLKILLKNLILKVFLNSLDTAIIDPELTPNSGILPQTLRQAIIFLILKKDKDPLQCSDCPISLLCAIVKLLAKILVHRLELLLRPDMNGFIKNRHSFHNVRCFLNILYSTPFLKNTSFRRSPMSGVFRSGSGVEHKVSLYADDLLLFVSDPANSIPPVLTLLSEFGQTSGYKLNLIKSEQMPINKASSKVPLFYMPFKASLHSFKYLGVQVKCFADLFHHNFSPLIRRLTKDFHHWSLLPLSLVGRINCVKMNWLPKFLYLFQRIPIFIPKSFFC